MTKYVTIYEAIGDGTKDRGEKTFFLALAKDSVSKTTTGYKKLEIYPLSDIDYIDCYRIDKLQSGNFAAGVTSGLLAGGVAGAVIGGLVNSGKKQSWRCEISIQGRIILYRLNDDRNKDILVKWATKQGVLKAD